MEVCGKASLEVSSAERLVDDDVHCKRRGSGEIE